MGQGVKNLKLFAVSLIATLIIMSIAGIWGALGYDGPVDGIGSVAGLFADWRIIGIVLVLVGVVVAGDRIME